MGTTALVLGIVGAVTSWVPLLGCLGWVACVLAIVFGSIGIANVNSSKATNKGSAATGLGLGIAGLVIGLVIAVTVWGMAEWPPDEAASETAVSAATDSASESATEDADEAVQATEDAEEPTGTGEGTWEVGTEIEPGTYVTTAPDDGLFGGCYVARLSGFSGEFTDLIANDNIAKGSRGRITIFKSDTGVEFSGSCRWEIATEENAVDPGDDIGEGTWEVGTEIEPGEYVTRAEGEGILDSCYVARLSGFGMELEEIIANDNINGGAQGRITIDESDAGIQFSGGCTWSKG